MLKLLIENVEDYQAKSITFYNVQTTHSTFVSEIEALISKAKKSTCLLRYGGLTAYSP